MYLSHAGESSRTQGTPVPRTAASCGVCNVFIRQKDMAYSWADPEGTSHYICVGCHEAGNIPFFDARVHQRNQHERVHIAEQMHVVTHRMHELESERVHITEQMHVVMLRMHGLESERTRLAGMQQNMAGELRHCKETYDCLVVRDGTLQTYVERDVQAKKYHSGFVFAHPFPGAGGGLQVARSTLLDGVERDGNISSSHSTPLITKMQIGLTTLGALASAWATMSEAMIEAKGDTFYYNLRCLAVKCNFDPGSKSLIYANVLGVTEDVFLTELIRKMFFCDFFANNTTSRFQPAVRSNSGIPRAKYREVLLAELHKITTNMIANFSSNLFTVNMLEATSAGTFTHARSAILCAVGIVCKGEDVYYREMSDGEMSDGEMPCPGDDNDASTYTRISPHITNNVDHAPLLSFQVPKNKAFSLYLFNLSDADLCVLKGTLVENKHHNSVIIEGDVLISQKCSSRKNEPDTNIPANGVSLVVHMTRAQPSTTQKYELKDANNRVFLYVETSLATRSNQ